MKVVDSSVANRYSAKADAGELNFDLAQHQVAIRLDRLREQLAERQPAVKKNPLSWLFSDQNKRDPARGLYIYGGVGRGKTMLMDMFHAGAPDLPKRRVHFHAFMQDVHARIKAWRDKSLRGEVKGDDPIAPVAGEIARSAKLLCFDEFQVEDIADAMILSRLLDQLFRRQVVIVATSNCTPEQLYRDGLNRDLFLPCIKMLRDRLDVVSLKARADYRLEKLAGRTVYFCPLDEQADAAMDQLWSEMAGAAGFPGRLQHQGRAIRVPLMAGAVARFGFADLCAQPLGAGDYLRVAGRFHTIFIDNIPALDADNRNEARRLITLIDALYDQGVKLIVSAQAEPDSLYTQGTGSFAFQRTASRLMEMRSCAYMSRPHRRREQFGRPEGDAAKEKT